MSGIPSPNEVSASFDDPPLSDNTAYGYNTGGIQDAYNNNEGVVANNDASIGNMNNNRNIVNINLGLEEMVKNLSDLRCELGKRKNFLFEDGKRPQYVESSYETKVKALKQEISTLRFDLSTENDLRKKLEVEAQRCREELDAAIERKHSELRQQMHKVESLERDISALKSRLSVEESEAQRRCRELEDMWNRKRGELHDHQDKVRSLEMEISSLQFKLAGVEDLALRRREEIINVLEEKRHALQKERNEVERLDKEVSSLKADISEVNRRKSESEAEIQRQHEELGAEYEKERRASIEMKTAYEKEVEEQKNCISALVRRREEVEREVQQERQERENLIEEQRCALVDMQEQCGKVVADQNNEISILESKLVEVVRCGSEFEAEAQKKRQELEVALAGQLRQVQDQRNMIAEHHKEISRLQSQLSGEINYRKEVEEAAQVEYKKLEAAIDENCQSYLARMEEQKTFYEKSVRDQKEETLRLNTNISQQTEMLEKAKQERKELETSLASQDLLLKNTLKQKTAYEQVIQDHRKEIYTLNSEISKGKDEILGLKSVLSEERRDHHESQMIAKREDERERKKLEAEFEKKHCALLEEKESYKTKLEKQKEEIATLKSKLSAEIVCKVEVEENSKKELKKLETEVEKERHEIYNLRITYENDIEKQKKETFTFRDKLAKEIRLRAIVEGKAKLDLQKLEAIVEEKHCVIIDMKTTHEKEIQRQKEDLVALLQLFSRRTSTVEDSIPNVNMIYSFGKALDDFLDQSSQGSGLDHIASYAEQILKLITFRSKSSGSKNHVALFILEGIQIFKEQDCAYLQAIDMNINTAEQGCALSKNAIDFCSLLLDPSCDGQEISEHASELRSIATRAAVAATEASGMFRNIRTTLLGAIRHIGQTFETIPGFQPKFTDPESSILQNIVDGLFTLYKSVDLFAGWVVDMETNLKVIEGQSMSDTTPPRVITINKRWEEVGHDYASYKLKIGRLRSLRGLY